ncbi:MAG: hypothetical protein ABII94_01600 [Patescibacteria group bacterium]
MKIESKYKLDKITANDSSRPAMNHVFIEDNIAVATNGHVLAIVPVEIEEGDTGGILSKDSFVAARKLAKKNNDLQIKLNGTEELIDGTQRPRLDLKYPDYKLAIQDYSGEETRKICLNAKYLYELSQALGTDLITLEITESNTRTIIIHNLSLTSERPVSGFILPVRG